MTPRFFVCLLIFIISSSFSQNLPFPELELEPVLESLTLPTYATSAKDGSGRLFVVQLDGFVRIVQNGELLDSPFLNLDGQVTALSGEQAMYSIAFHPNYAENGRFFVTYAEVETNRVIVAEHSVSSRNPNYAYRNVRNKLILSFTPDAPYHQGGQLKFGPDGYLYVSFGDGGTPLFTYTAGFDKALSLDSFAGKILRIDVDNGDPYSIPEDNPFSSLDWVPGEIYALGFRNPWKFSFDFETGELLAADVGNYDWEEINKIVAGGNYGWPAREGPVCFVFPDTKAIAVENCELNNQYLDPLISYGHLAFDPDGGNAVVSGYVYRGQHYPEMNGFYVYGDFTNGKIWLMRRQEDKIETKLALDTDLQITSFAEDDDGELYVLSIRGGLYKIKPVVSP